VVVVDELAKIPVGQSGTKVAFNIDGLGERRWVRQAVMGVLRWRDLPGNRSSLNNNNNNNNIINNNTLRSQVIIKMIDD
jgi:hypothetical protein